MNKIYRSWWTWILCAVVVVTFGFVHGWTTFDKILLVAIGVLGVLRLVGPVLHGGMLRRVKGMSPEEREKFIAQLDPKSQDLLRKQLELYDPNCCRSRRADRLLFAFSFDCIHMLSWLKQKIAGTEQRWLRAQQVPGIPFPFPKGARLKPDEEVILALPAALITGQEKIGSVLLCDDDAELTLNEKVGAWFVKLKPGMVFSLAKSCEIMLIANDTRPRSFQINEARQQTH